jgi:hypothetical protein
VGETAACLTSVAAQADADVLLAPSIERAGDETVVTLLYYDARGAGELRNASRRHRGASVERAALDAVPAMVREVLGASEPIATEPQPAQPATEAQLADVEEEPQVAAQRSFPVVPVVLGVAGLAIAGVGLAFGLAAKADEEQYAGLPLDTEEQVAAAEERFGKAEDQALIANIGLGVGAAVFAGGVVLLAFELSAEQSEPQAQLAPMIGPDRVGLALRGRFAGAP